MPATDDMALGAGLEYETCRTDDVGPDMQMRIDAFLRAHAAPISAATAGLRMRRSTEMA